MSKSQVISETQLTSGFLKVVKLELETPKLNGEGAFKQIREVAKQSSSVFLLPYDSQTNEVVILKQHRAGAIDCDSTLVLEPIAGRIDYKSTPEEIVVNEADEEAGLNISTSDLIKIGEFLSSPGGSTELCHMYIVKCDLSSLPEVSYHGLADEGEDIECIKIKQENIDNLNGLQSLQLAMLLKSIPY